jgi:hypothetical protein
MNDPDLDTVAERVADQMAYDNVVVVAQREPEHEVAVGHNRGRDDTLTAYIGLLETVKDRWLDKHWRGNDRDSDDGSMGDILPGDGR